MASVTDTKDTRGTLIAADQVEGTSIYNRAGESLGKVEDLMLDKMSGRVAYVVAGFGGFLGIGNRYYPLPWEKLTYDPNMGGFVVDLDRRMLEGAPYYSETEPAAWDDPAWGRRVHDYYGMERY